jgi:hypothetical protein
MPMKAPRAQVLIDAPAVHSSSSPRWVNEAPSMPASGTQTACRSEASSPRRIVRRRGTTVLMTGVSVPDARLAGGVPRTVRGRGRSRRPC